jgi:UMF1 family MFS transporter
MQHLEKESKKKLLNAWAFYDWANSVSVSNFIGSISNILWYCSRRKIYQCVLGYFKNSALISFVTAFAFFWLFYFTITFWIS